MMDFLTTLPLAAIDSGALSTVGIIFLVIIAFIIFLAISIMTIRCYRKVDQGSALIINKLRAVPDVTFTGGVVLPIIHKAEVMDISVKAMVVKRDGKNGLICADNIRADISVSFYIRVNKTQEDVMRVAQTVGCARASQLATLDDLFQAKFSEALKTVGKQMEFTTLFTERKEFKENIIKVIGEDLNGYRLEDVAIDYLEQTPLSALNPDNILDAQGIRKITELTSIEAKQTNSFTRDRETTIKQQDVSAKEKMLELERQQAEAEARQKREIEAVRARETAEAEKIKAEEALKAQLANIKTEEEVRVASENKERQAQIAAKAREKAILVETERVQKDKELEAVERERQVALKSIEKEKEVETQKKAIADIIRERVKVERTVTEEQEHIKDTVAFAGAERSKKVEVTKAEEQAEQDLVKTVKAAEAREKAAQSQYNEKVKLADAVKSVAERESEAQLLRAEKEAAGKKALAEAAIAENAAGGLAEVRVKESNAAVIELQGKAEANALLAKAEAEAQGINQKAEAMHKFDSMGRDHEEFKLNLGLKERVQMAAISANREIAEAQAEVLGEAMKAAKIDIVGGNGEFLEKFFKSISLGKAVDGLVEHSGEAQKLVAGDDSNIATKLAEVIADSGINTDSVKDMSLATILAKIATKPNGKELIAQITDALK